MSYKINPMLLGDGYKQAHANLYEEGGEKIYATWTPRSAKNSGTKDCDGVVTFGLQSFVQEWLIDYFNEEFFQKDIEEILTDYNKTIKAYLNSEGLGEDRIRALHALGYLPLKITALEEGTICPIKVPMLTIENTLPEFFWLTNFMESFMSAELWSAMTTATIAREYRKLMDKWADKTCDDNSHVDFQGHDFSLRGFNTVKASLASGAGHLLSFKGTDSIPTIGWLEKYYNADNSKEMFACSVPATEHSIMEFNSAGKENDEYDAFKRIVTEVHPNGIVSVVSDTWNLWDVLTKTIPSLKQEILARDGKVVIRPDSGNPVDIICGKEHFWIPSTFGGLENEKGEWCKSSKNYYSTPYEFQEAKGVIELLWDTFGGTTNSKGYKVLDSHIGAIYGDAITLERAEQICSRLESKGFASSNITFGIGSFTYQYNTRDTFGFALKSTYAIKDGKEVFLFKDPITDDGIKKSQKGMVGVFKDNEGKIYYEDEFTQSDRDKETGSMLTPLFENGKFLRKTSLSEIKNKLNKIKVEA